jgi:hypothetical protein
LAGNFQRQLFRVLIAILVAVGTFASQRVEGGCVNCADEISVAASGGGEPHAAAEAAQHQDSQSPEKSGMPEKHCACSCHHAAGPAVVFDSASVLTPVVRESSWEALPVLVRSGRIPGGIERPPQA